MKVFYKIAQYLLILALVTGLVLYFEADIKLAISNLNKIVSPCGESIKYTVHNLDEEFGVSRDDLLKAISRAAEIWEKPLNKKLFAFTESGALSINLIYDSRQEATDKLKKLGIEIHSDQATYETLKSKYNAFNKTYQAQKTEIDSLIKYFEEQKADYEDEVKAANRRGGATPDEFAILDEERKNLNNLVEKIKQKQEIINKTVENINAAASVINRLIYELNLNVSNYNNIGEKTTGEFQEGEYVSDQSGQRINIYQFDTKEQLVRVLAHELGHALGLEHLNNPEAIMYRLNESGNNQITADDLAELKKACKIK